MVVSRRERLVFLNWWFGEGILDVVFIVLCCEGLGDGKKFSRREGERGGVSFFWVILEVVWCFCFWFGFCNSDFFLEYYLNLGMKFELF